MFRNFVIMVHSVVLLRGFMGTVVGCTSLMLRFVGIVYTYGDCMSCVYVSCVILCLSLF